MSHRFAGARGEIRDPEASLRTAAEWAKARGIEVLLADARIVFGPDHLESAARHAERAQANGTMVARGVALEALRFLSGERQVSDAIKAAGIRRGGDTAALVVFGDGDLEDLLGSLGWTRDDSVLAAGGKDLSALGISRRMRETVEPGRAADLALERVALVDVER